ncbi:uncharacterized protein YALI1_B10762g [Yarrowia lipolytica]|uniref:Uncharacterized protein n=1 Tax=Yarrowia lipolytica TaxID=4952 RepID=A0A1D8N6X7_YARLL|nr:hypothetical protein YALI1_B10762g [Yarrowia lipolytica]
METSNHRLIEITNDRKLQTLQTIFSACFDPQPTLQLIKATTSPILIIRSASVLEPHLKPRESNESDTASEVWLLQAIDRRAVDTPFPKPE